MSNDLYYWQAQFASLLCTSSGCPVLALFGALRPFLALCPLDSRASRTPPTHRAKKMCGRGSGTEGAKGAGKDSGHPEDEGENKKKKEKKKKRKKRKTGTTDDDEQIHA